MIQDVDESLRVLVRRDALNGGDVDIAFDAPTRDWSARRNTPTLDLYLYDIREDLVRREVMWDEVRDERGRVTVRRPPATTSCPTWSRPGRSGPRTSTGSCRAC